MKHKFKSVMSLTLALLMVGSAIPTSVFAVDKSDDSIQVTSETSALEVTDEKTDGIQITEGTSESSDIDVKTVEKEVGASIAVSDDGIVMDALAGQDMPVKVSAFNKSKELDSEFRLYFYQTLQELPEDAATWHTAVKNPCMNVQVVGVDEQSEVSLLTKSGDAVTAKVQTEKDVNGNVMGQYVAFPVKASSEVEVSLSLTAAFAEEAVLLPVMVTDTVKTFGNGQLAKWSVNDILITDVTESEDIVIDTKESDIEISDEVSTETEDDTMVKDTEDVMVSDETSEETKEDSTTVKSDVDIALEVPKTEGVQVSAGTKDILNQFPSDAVLKVTESNEVDKDYHIYETTSLALNTSDFVTKRLVLLTEDASLILNESDIIGQYDNVYLLEFPTVEQAMNAYSYFQEKGQAVEPDVMIQTASESEGTGIEVSEKQNALMTLSELPESKTSDGVIALIDTGVKESSNIVDRISVIDDVLDGNGHGDDMADAIVSQNANAKILSIRAMNDNGFGTISSLVAAMEYAIDQKVDMINLSLYARTTLSTSVLKSEIQKATDAGILVVGAAGNDGADVINYVPGSVAEAYIIGAADAHGRRIETSNYGLTVDYNVVADSTSKAAALFTGYVSANGLDAIGGILNQGFVYATNFVEDNTDTEDKPADEFEKYTYDATKKAVIRYTYGDINALEDGDTITSVYHEVEDGMMGGSASDKFFATVDDTADIYAVGDGTYKFKVDTPIKCGYLPESGYMDYIIANGNNNGEVLTEGVSFDTNTGIVTCTEDALKKADGDFANIQIQVLVPVEDIPRIKQTVQVVSPNGFVYEQKLTVYGLVNEMIPIDVTGVDGELTSADFEVYLNDRKTPCAVAWNQDEQALMIRDEYPVNIYAIKVMVKKDTDAVFKTAYKEIPNDHMNDYNSYGPMFYLPDGTDVSGLTVNARSDDQDAIFGALSYNDYPATPPPAQSQILGTAHEWTGPDDGGMDGGSSLGYLGLPQNLFGINFVFCDAGGNSLTTWDGYNAAIKFPCVHSGDGISNVTRTRPVNCRIISVWDGGSGYKCFAMSVVTKYALTGGNYNQSLGGVITFAVKDQKKTDITVKKVWDDRSDRFKIRPKSITMELQWVEDGYSNWSSGYKTVALNAGNNWSHTWTDEIYQGSGKTYKYRVVEYDAKDYTKQNPQITGSNDLGWTYSFKNVVDTGFIQLHKSSSNVGITNGNKCYDLSGAVYGIFTDAACTKQYATWISGDYAKLTTDKYGDSNTVEVVPGNYYIMELEAPTNGSYYKDWKDESKGIMNTYGPFKVTKNNTNDKPVMAYVEDEPKNDPAGISMTKLQSGEANDLIPSLVGTEFTIKYYDGYYTKNNLPATATRKWVIRIKDKKAGGQYMCLLTDSYLVADKSDSLYYSRGGAPILPLGTITIQETKAAPGYTLNGHLEDINGNKISTDSELYVSQIVDEKSGVTLQGGNEFTSKDEPIPGGLIVKKFDKDGKTTLAGVSYELKDSKGNVVSTGTTKSDGKVEFKDLYPGKYTITELKTKAGLSLLKEPIEISMPMYLTEQDVIDNKIDKTKCVFDDYEGIYMVFDQTYEVTNDANFVPPMTGGMTTLWTFLPLGIGLLLFSGIMVLVVRKKKQK